MARRASRSLVELENLSHKPGWTGQWETHADDVRSGNFVAPLPRYRGVMTDILALDLATTTGIARGKVGGTPLADTVHFAAHAGASNDSVFAAALAKLSTYLNADKPDWIVVEAMLPPDAMKGATSRAVRDRLSGLHGIVRAVAYLRGIYRIDDVQVMKVRRHFLGDVGLRREPAKRLTVERCRKLGWKCDDDNQGDALALWSFACAQVDPTTALMVSPLFNRSLRITPQ